MKTTTVTETNKQTNKQTNKRRKDNSDDCFRRFNQVSMRSKCHFVGGNLRSKLFLLFYLFFRFYFQLSVVVLLVLATIG